MWTENIAPGDYELFREKYRTRPGQFVVDCFDWKADDGPAPYQIEILDSILSRRRVSVRGPRGLGKTSLAAWAIIWFAFVHDVDFDWKIPTTASAWSQLEYFLWPEIHKWVGKLRWDLIGRNPVSLGKELLTLQIKLSTGRAFAITSDQEDSTEGAHASKVLYLFDESKAIRESIWDSAEGALSTGDCYFLSISTPGDPIGRFFDIQTNRESRYSDWYARQVTCQEAIDAGRISIEWVQKRRTQWGEKSQLFQNHVMGEFAQSAADVLIPVSWVELANERWYELSNLFTGMPSDQVGIDVAWGGEDSSVIANRTGYYLHPLKDFQDADTMLLAEEAMLILSKSPAAHVVVDVIGYGAGTHDRLKELHNPDNVHAFHAQARVTNMDITELWEFNNAYSAAWYHLRDLLNPLNKIPIALPPDEDLTSDLVAPKWQPRSGNVIEVEQKRKVKERLERSPDRGEAVALAYFEVDLGGMDAF